MTTIELLKERIDKTAPDYSGKAAKEHSSWTPLLNQLAIMQALVELFQGQEKILADHGAMYGKLEELLEKVDQPMEFSIPTQTPNVTQYIIGKPVTVIPKGSFDVHVPQTPNDDDFRDCHLCMECGTPVERGHGTVCRQCGVRLAAGIPEPSQPTGPGYDDFRDSKHHPQNRP